MAVRRHAHLDEDDVRVRPGRGNSRPRSKDRPGHEQAASAMVVAVDRGRFTLALNGEAAALVYAVKARELGRKGLVVGDHVDVVGDLAGGLDSPARIVRRRERTSDLRRTADDADPVERVVVANATRLAIVTATADPEPSYGLIDRALVAAFDADIEPLLVITKTDLRPPDDILAMYAPMDLTVIEAGQGRDIEPLARALAGQVTVMLGHSGVGKSTLVNALVPSAERTTGRVNLVTGKGRHTSTSAVALPLPAGGWIIDTPGIRSFGLAHVQTARLMHAFTELEPGTTGCPRACTHDEPDCALDAWVAEQPRATAARLASFRRLQASRAAALAPYAAPRDQAARAPE